MPNITGTARDLEADLAICEAATPGPWRSYELDVTQKDNRTYWHIAAGRGYLDDDLKGFELSGYISQADARCIAEVREGWPYAIRRALAAEAEVDRLRHEIEILREQLEQRCARA